MFGLGIPVPNGQSAASEAITEMNAIETQSRQTVSEIEELFSKIEEIEDISNLIAEITEQTNMLALNAAIEAARADEDGNGFAVVAEEIKQLADETAAATESIEKRIDEVHETAERAVGDIREMDDRVVTGTDTISEALHALDDVADNVAEMNQRIQDINATMDDQAGSTSAVAETIDEVSTAAQQVSFESDTVSAPAKEQTATLTDALDRTEQLSEQASRLQTRLDAFTIGANRGQNNGKPDNRWDLPSTIESYAGQFATGAPLEGGGRLRLPDHKRESKCERDSCEYGQENEDGCRGAVCQGGPRNRRAKCAQTEDSQIRVAKRQAAMLRGRVLGDSCLAERLHHEQGEPERDADEQQRRERVRGRNEQEGNHDERRKHECHPALRFDSVRQQTADELAGDTDCQQSGIEVLREVELLGHRPVRNWADTFLGSNVD
jgi:hypothetical protein